MSHEAADQSFESTGAFTPPGAFTPSEAPKLIAEWQTWHWLALATGIALIASALLF